MTLDLTVYAIPAFIGLMLAEGVVLARTSLRGYAARDTAASLAMGVGNVLIDLVMKGVHFALLAAVGRWALFAHRALVVVVGGADRRRRPRLLLVPPRPSRGAAVLGGAREPPLEPALQPLDGAAAVVDHAASPACSSGGRWR